MNVEEYKALLAKEKKSKQRGQNFQPIEVDGYRFASKFEASVYGMLRFRQSALEIAILKVQDQVRIELPNGQVWGCRPDFKCQALVDLHPYKESDIFWVEAKGFEHDRWKATRVIWSLYGPGIQEVWKGKASNPMLTEYIEPYFL